jgi:hemolysin activation/secretion protein
MKRDLKLWPVALALGLAPTAAQAIQIPGSAEPGQIEQRLDQPPPVAPGNGAGELPVLPQPAPQGQAGGESIMLNDLVLDGVTVYAPDTFRPLYAGKLGHEISFADVQSIAEQITRRYLADGYILSQAVIPDQNVEHGVLHIRVVEGFIAHVNFDGEASAQMRRYADQIMQDRPMNIATLERYVLLMNDLPGVHAESVLQPSTDTFGAADLVLKVSRQTVDGSVVTDNRGSKYNGPEELSNTVAGNSLLGLDDRTQLRFATVNPAFEMRLFDLLETVPVSSTGTMLGLEASRTFTKPGFTLETIQINAISNDYQFYVSHPLIRSRTENLTLQGTFDYRDTNTEIFENTPYTDDRLRVLRGKATYTDADQLGGTNVLDAQLSRGLNIFNASSSGDDRSREFGVSNFTKLDADVSRTQPLPYQLSVMTALTGQYSADPLLTSEQLGLGGAQFGSAYDPSEVLGDQGIAARLEFRYDDRPASFWLTAYQPYLFYDIGEVWDKHETGEQPHSLTDAGIGLRATVAWNVTASSELAFPLTKPPETELNNNPYNPRFFFSLGWAF